MDESATRGYRDAAVREPGRNGSAVTRFPRVGRGGSNPSPCTMSASKASTVSRVRNSSSSSPRKLLQPSQTQRQVVMKAPNAFSRDMSHEPRFQVAFSDFAMRIIACTLRSTSSSVVATRRLKFASRYGRATPCRRTSKSRRPECRR